MLLVGAARQVSVVLGRVGFTGTSGRGVCPIADCAVGASLPTVANVKSPSENGNNMIDFQLLLWRMSVEDDLPLCAIESVRACRAVFLDDALSQRAATATRGFSGFGEKVSLSTK